MLVSLFILGGCKNPSGIGLDVDPNVALNSLVNDTSTVSTKLIKQDSVTANYTSSSILAYFKDPVFGTTTGNIAVALTLPSANYSFGDNPVIDSAVLVLPFKGFYGDSLNTDYTVEVRQLDEVLYNESQKTYYTAKKWAVKPTVLGTKNFKAAYRDSLILQDIIAGRKDTVKRVPAQLRIKLDPTFITNNILKADSSNLASNLAFNNFIKGLYISLNKNTTTNNGGIFSLDTYTADASKLDLFYKKTSSTGGVDTTNVSLSISGSNGFAASELSWDLDGTPVQTELQSNTNSNNNLYFKGLSGTQVKIDFPYLNKLKAIGSNIAINRAELILKVVNGTETPYTPIPRLRAFRWDIAERRQFLPDENSNDPRYLGAGYIGGYYDSTHHQYVFNFTGYIQDLLNGKTKNYGTFITTSDFSNPGNALNELGRSVTGGGAHITYKAQLKIYYTDLK